MRLSEYVESRGGGGEGGRRGLGKEGVAGRGNYNAARHVNSCQLPAHDTRQHNWLWSHYAGILMGPHTHRESDRETEETKNQKQNQRGQWAKKRGAWQPVRQTEIAFTRRAQFMALLWLI